MNPLDYITGLRRNRARQVGLDSVQIPQADNNAFPTLADPSLIHDFMQQQSDVRRASVESGSVRGYATPMSPGEAEEISAARNYNIPTMWGKIMNRRMGGIQGRGVAGALGKSVNPAAGPQSLQNFQNEALQQQYPFADLLKRFR